MTAAMTTAATIPRRSTCQSELAPEAVPYARAGDDGMLGESPALRSIRKAVGTVAVTGSTVLVRGETGTGKELIARAIHENSPNRAGPFIKVNCAAIPATLLESELFGHEKGAFTGALQRRAGRFELAHRGTLFLDEIGELPVDLQPKLLRVLQEREFERVGGVSPLAFTARVVAATNRDLRAMVDERTFRADLYYRLNVFPIEVAPLRERREDIPLLAEVFVRRLARRMNKDVPEISAASMQRLVRYEWPGNIRELQNVLERAVILTEGPVLDVPLAPAPRPSPADASCGDALQEVQRRHILSVLEKTAGVVGGPNGAAQRLGMKRSTLNFRMKKLGIVRGDRA
jgi:formate hydrogenlyase transcriptional activator